MGSITSKALTKIPETETPLLPLPDERARKQLRCGCGKEARSLVTTKTGKTLYYCLQCLRLVSRGGRIKEANKDFKSIQMW
jgi:hypothetical protein